MKSNMFTFMKESIQLEQIFSELETMAKECSLTKKETLRLRLLAEELLGMLPELLEYREGRFWITNNGKSFELHAEAEALENTKEMEQRVLSVSKSGKNEAEKGFMAKVRQVAMLLFHAQDDSIASDQQMAEYCQDGKWSLRQYRYQIEAQEDGGHEEQWDELEKSIVANLADDVIVRIVDKKVEIIIKKVFNSQVEDLEFLNSPLLIDIEERYERRLNGSKNVFLKDIHMKVDPGQMILILGGSGAGKTTFINAVTGYEKAEAVIRKGNLDVYKDYGQMKHCIAFAPQQDLLRDEETVYHTLADAAYMKMPASRKKAEREQRIDEIIEMFGLVNAKNSMVRKLSGGQRKRLSIGVEFISDPVIFFLDEPDSGLDGIMARSLMENLRKIVGEYRQIFVISHSPDRVIDLFDKVIVLAKSPETKAGQLAFFGSPDEAKEFFGVTSMEGIVKVINRVDEGGEGRADEMIRKYKEYQRREQD